ncbi:biotin-dependent carboxyltransferase family protein [Microbulbifer sp. ARAS458-1]|uniref:5-oxoprolinase subunit C family protein n=1 Tax=Microbulbifer sp. ARAS458-1 TaxID=3140242 RepID=UPI003877978E
MTLRVLKPGLQTTVQDAGRPGNLRWGVARGGAADTFAMALANLLLANPLSHPCLEVALTGPELEFTCELSIAICGAEFDLLHNRTPVGNDQVLQMRPGDILRFGGLRSGARAYIALAAELAIDRRMGSLSTHVISGFGGFAGRALQAGDQLPLRNCRIAKTRSLPGPYRLDYRSRPLLRTVDGVEAHCFSENARQQLGAGNFTVSPQSNRMGIRLNGPPLPQERAPQQVSSALCPGTIQVPPNGLPIISFVEGQTIGGYPRIAHVISADVHRLGQLTAGTPLNLETIDAEVARQIQREKASLLMKLPDLL